MFLYTRAKKLARLTHYTYKIEHLPTGRFYVGVRSSRAIPELDEYMGSGTGIRELVACCHLSEFVKTVLSTHPTREQAEADERRLVTTELLRDPRCLNRAPGGTSSRTGWTGYKEIYAEYVEARLRGKREAGKLMWDFCRALRNHLLVAAPPSCEPFDDIRHLLHLLRNRVWGRPLWFTERNLGLVLAVEVRRFRSWRRRASTPSPAQWARMKHMLHCLKFLDT